MTTINESEFGKLNSDISLAVEHERMVVFARNKEGQFAHIDSVPNGKPCECTCLACGESLVARQGGQRAHSFAHESGTECQYAVETMLHWLAKELIATHRYFVTPAHTVYETMEGPLHPIELSITIPSAVLQIDLATTEKRMHPIRPDIVLNVQGQEYLVEITVTHKCDAEKIAALKKLGLPAVEINLSKYRLETIADLKKVLFHESEFKTWLYNFKNDEAQRVLHEKALGQLASQESEYQRKCLEEKKYEEIAKALETAEREKEKLRENERIKALALLHNWTEEQSLFFNGKNFQRLFYTTIDGGLCLIHGSIETGYCKPNTGKEKALDVFKNFDIEFDPVIEAYSFPISLLKPIIINLSPHSLGICSL